MKPCRTDALVRAFDSANDLMSRRDRFQTQWDVALNDMEIGTTNAAGRDAN
jgi:hypothetical protein